MACPLNQDLGCRGFVKSGIIHTHNGVGWKLLQEMPHQLNVEPLRIGVSLKQNGSEQALAQLGRQQTGMRPSIVTSLSHNPVGLCSPPSVSICGALKSTFIRRPQLVSPLGQIETAYLMEVRSAFAGIALCV